MTGKLPAAVHLDLDGAADIFRAHGWPYDRPDDALFETGLVVALDFFRAAQISATLFVITQDLETPRKRALIQEAVPRSNDSP
jgi:hypothetical protein